MSQRIYLFATQGRSVPMEGGAGVIGEEPVAVIDSHYYRARVRAGELRCPDAHFETPVGAPTGAPAPSASDASATHEANDAEGTRDGDSSELPTTTTTSRRRAAQ